MTRFTPLWLQAGDYAASVDRRLVGALWPAARCDGAAVGITGLNDMAVAVQPGYVAVPTPNATGSTLCVSDAIETVPLDAAPAPGQDRIDLIVCAAHGGDLDALADGWAFEKVTGVVSVPPAVEPAVPAGTTLLARVNVTGGMVAVDAAHIIDRRPQSLAVPGRETVDSLPWSMPRGWVAGFKGLPAADASGNGSTYGPQLSFPVVAKRRYRVTYTLRGSTAAVGGCSIRVSHSPEWAPYQMAVERYQSVVNAALSGGFTTYFEATADGTHAVSAFLVGGGTVKVLGGSCSAIAEDIGGMP